MPIYTNQQKLGNNFLRKYGDTMFYSGGAITIYSGAQPTAVTVASDWASYKSSNAACLAHFISGPNWSFNAGTLTYYNTNNTSTTLTFNTGTATWAIVWTGISGSSTFTGAVSQVQLSSGTLPNSGGFAVVPVTDLAGTGLVKLADVNIVPGTTATTTSSGLTFSFA